MKKLTITLISLLLLTGCQTAILNSERRQLERQGQPPAYVDGYVDGHGSGTRAGGNPWFQFRKDAARFDSDSLYRQGWTDGFNTGKGQYESLKIR